MNVLHWILAIYLIAINLVTFVVYGMDKWKAKTDRWRISERTLLTLAVAGGSIGAFAAMQSFRHKTRNKVFMTGIPVLMIVQLVLIYYAFGD